MEVDEGEESQYDGKGGRIGAAESLARKGQLDMIPGFWIFNFALFWSISVVK